MTTLPNFPRQTSENIWSTSGTEEKMISFPKNLFVKLFVWTCTMKFWQACRIVVAKNTKKIPELQKSWSYNFFNKTLFSTKNDSLATENAFFTTLAKTFLKKYTDLQLGFQRRRKNREVFERIVNFLEMFQCTCRMQLWQPCEEVGERRKNDKLSKKPIRQIFPLSMHNENLASLQ